MASIAKKGNSWTIRYYQTNDFGQCKQHRLSGYASKAEALRALEAVETALSTGTNIQGGKMTCGQLMEMWFQMIEPTVEVTTASRYSANINRLMAHPVYDMKVGKLTSKTLLSLIAELKQGDKDHKPLCTESAKDATSPLRMALRWAVREHMIIANPFENAKMPKSEHREQRVLSSGDAKDFADFVRKRNPAFLIPVELALYGGLCREEVAGLTWTEVNFEQQLVIVRRARTLSLDSAVPVMKGPKTSFRARSVTLPQFVMDDLEKRKGSKDEYVAISSDGKPYALYSYASTIRRLVQAFNAERSEVGLPSVPRFTFHDLRHTHAALCIEMGIQPKVISERLGHSSIKITMDLYGYLMPGMQKAVADAFDAQWGNQEDVEDPESPQ